jgi:hypothetical protein
MNIKIVTMIVLASSAVVIAGFAVNNSSKNSEKNAVAATNNLSDQSEIMQNPTNATNSANTNQTFTEKTIAAVKKQKNTTKITDALKLRYNAVSNNPQYPTIEDRIVALENMYPEQSIDPENLVDTLSQPTAWKDSAGDGKGLHLSEEHLKDGREFIEFDRERVAVMLPGDKIELPIKDLGGAVKVVIDSIKDEGANTLTWSGHVEGAKDFMRVSITQGDGISVGLIETENATYNLQSNDNKGWIASTAVLMKHDPADGLIVVDEHDHSATDHHHQ